MKMKITFLGTASMQPTADRNLTSIYFSHEGEHILFDCGEGTQRQLRIAGISPTKITRIIISHFHADHFLGLGGLIRTLDANQYNKTIFIYGPKGLQKLFESMTASLHYQPKIKIKLIEIKPGKIVDAEKFTIEAYPLDHSVQCFGFRIKEKDRRKINMKYLEKLGLTQHPVLGDLQKGRDIIWENKKISAKKGTYLLEGKTLSIILDTGYSEKIIKATKGADLLVCESTYSERDREIAREYKHMTAVDAAKIAKKAKVKRLVLTHFSQRYKEVMGLENEAKKVFKNTVAAKDFMSFDV